MRFKVHAERLFGLLSEKKITNYDVSFRFVVNYINNEVVFSPQITYEQSIIIIIDQSGIFSESMTAFFPLQTVFL